MPNLYMRPCRSREAISDRQCRTVRVAQVHNGGVGFETDFQVWVQLGKRSELRNQEQVGKGRLRADRNYVL